MHKDVPVERRAAVTFFSGGVQRFVVEAVLHAHPTFISRVANESLRIIADHCANCEDSCILCCPQEGGVRLLEHGSNSRNLQSPHLGATLHDHGG